MKGQKPIAAERRRLRGDRNPPLPSVIGGRRPPPLPPVLEPDMVDAWNYIIDDLVAADVIDHADAGVIEQAAVMWGRARQARAQMMGQELVIATPQGVVVNKLLIVERDAWRAFRALAEMLPLSPWGRARLGLRSQGAAHSIEDEIGKPPRLKVVNDSDDE